MSIWLLSIPFISAFIGWFTNWIAIKMLFHPKEPKKILFLTFHGVFPKRQRQFAEKLGKLVSTELLSFKEIEEKIVNPENLKKLMPFVENKVDDFLRRKLSDAFPIISMFIGDSTINQLKTIFMAELEIIFPEMIASYMKNLESQLDLEKIVTEKVYGFSSDKMESILNQIMSKEFKFIEVIGAVLGFIIGLLQIGITLLAN
ncbi:MAG: DUF445 domain-containing protein [Chitinophagaceae bacterium]|jgi:uncharacterized membrane protein YheB (UPF0754 family)